MGSRIWYLYPFPEVDTEIDTITEDSETARAETRYDQSEPKYHYRPEGGALEVGSDFHMFWKDGFAKRV